jgi:Uma2 family endonuclease
VATTWDDLQLLPDDGYRRELVHGQLLVTPAPSHHHQRASFALARALHAACPPSLEVLMAPFDWCLDEETVFEPDIMVLERSSIGERRFVGRPVLVVEVESPSTRDTDRTLKRFEYEQGQAGAYWLLDPVVPTLTALRLVDGTYRSEGGAHGDERFVTDFPFPVTVVPAGLLR